ncbi:MAG: shikimate kinase [Saprospiraceae bacterium]
MENAIQKQMLFLTGFMGSGKTHVGKKLATLLDMPFLDLDEDIVEKAGKSVHELFAQHGEAWFRLLERRALHDTLFIPPSIVATGGGAPCFFNNMDWMNTHGKTIFMDASLPVLVKRLWKGKEKRPLLKDLSEDQLEVSIQSRVSGRLPYYHQAHVHYPILDGEQNNVEGLLSLLSRADSL